MFVPFEGVRNLHIGTTWPAFASRRAVDPLLRYASQSLDSTFNANLQKRNYTTGITAFRRPWHPENPMFIRSNDA